MKHRIWRLCLVLLAGLLLAAGCAGTAADDQGSKVPARDTGNEGIVIEITQAQLDSQPNIAQSTEAKHPQSIVVSLPSNPSTGFSWTEAKISNTTVITQTERNEVAGKTGMVGAPGKTVWTFKTAKTGQVTIKMEYGRPWEGGEKAVKTFTLTVTVK